MSYKIYETEYLVLDSRPVSEAGISFSLFTKEFGFIHASAQGVREMKSKLRYSLQKYMIGSVWLVRGKSGWRITNAMASKNLFELFRKENRKLLFLARIVALLRRLLAGTEENKELFTIVLSGLEYLESLPESEVLKLEPVLLLRILDRLGYVGNMSKSESFIKTDLWSLEILAEAVLMMPVLVGEVNRSLRESQL